MPDSAERLRVQSAVETASDPEPVAIEVPDEARTLLQAAVEQIGNTLVREATGIAPVIGAGVLATVISQARNGTEPDKPTGSRIDTRG